MIGHSMLPNPPFLDITGPDGVVEIEYDKPRGVLYVHCEGVTVLRICRMTGGLLLTTPKSETRKLP